MNNPSLDVTTPDKLFEGAGGVYIVPPAVRDAGGNATGFQVGGPDVTVPDPFIVNMDGQPPGSVPTKKPGVFGLTTLPTQTSFGTVGFTQEVTVLTALLYRISPVSVLWLVAMSEKHDLEPKFNYVLNGHLVKFVGVRFDAPNHAYYLFQCDE